MRLDLARRRTIVPAALLACAALAAGGCGEKQGGRDGAATTATTATTATAATTAQPTTATTAREPDPGDLVAVALATLLTPDDAPDGWTSSGTAYVSRALLERCAPPGTGVTVTAPFFENDSVMLVQTVQLLPDARRARATVAAMTSPSGRDCAAALIADGVAGPNEQLPEHEQVRWGKPELGPFAPLPVGDDGAGLRVCLTGKAATLGARERACTELSMYRVGAAVATVWVEADSDAIPRQPVDELVATAVERLAGVDAATHPAPPSAGGGAVERARSVAPRLSDLPAGWSETDRGSVRTDEPFATTADCRLPDDPAEAIVWSPHLMERTGHRSLSLAVVVLPRERAARALFAALGRADVRDCIAQDFHEQMRTEEVDDPEDLGPLRTSVFEPPAVGVDAAGQRITLEVFASGVWTTQITDGIVLRSGRAVAIVWQRTELPYKQPVTKELLATIAERLRAAGR